MTPHAFRIHRDVRFSKDKVGVRYGGSWNGLLVIELTEEGIVVDANGPLAGQALQYRPSSSNVA